MGVGSGLRVQMEMEKIRKRMEELQLAVRRGAPGLREQRDVLAGPSGRPAVQTGCRPDDDSGSSGAGGGGNSGGQPTGDPAAMTQKMGESLGGATVGGGFTAGRRRTVRWRFTVGWRIAVGRRRSEWQPGGMPGGGPSTGTPKLPTDPSLRPAAASGGGGSGGGGAGGGSGGSSPLSPAVTAETVAPGPAVPRCGGHARSSHGWWHGGRDGRRHGAHARRRAGAQQGKEKRRDPRLAPDEDLYTEDRPWTEAVVGNRRRKDVQDGKEAK